MYTNKVFFNSILMKFQISSYDLYSIQLKCWAYLVAEWPLHFVMCKKTLALSNVTHNKPSDSQSSNMRT